MGYKQLRRRGAKILIFSGRNAWIANKRCVPKPHDLISVFAPATIKTVSKQNATKKNTAQKKENINDHAISGGSLAIIYV